MIGFLDHLAVSVLEPDSESDTSPRGERRFCEPLPRIVLCAHNGRKFDYAILASEAFRADVGWGAMQRWAFLDTLDVFRAIGTAHCVKLQCLLRAFGGDDGLRAHRALDDAIALRSIVILLAERFGVPLSVLLAPFVVEFDAPTSAAQISVLDS
jgi:DNA polymerase III epsilon subunit-like protein